MGPLAGELPGRLIAPSKAWSLRAAGLMASGLLAGACPLTREFAPPPGSAYAVTVRVITSATASSSPSPTACTRSAPATSPEHIGPLNGHRCGR
jgi:hypothetical protein